VKKPGQTEGRLGTTPTVMGADLVAITDNADPMNVVVYRRAAQVDGPRLVCKTPVFAKGASDTDQSLIRDADVDRRREQLRLLGSRATQNGNTTTPAWSGSTWTGAVAARSGARTRRRPRRWRSSRLRTASSTRTRRTRDDGEDGWYLTATSTSRPGRTLWKALGGEGLGHNNNYAPITLGPDGAAYVGVLGGSSA